jgi:K+-transporting ATPase KdpF subunit
VRAVRPGLRQDLTMADILGAAIGIFLIAYLFVAILKPEKF